MSDSRSHETGMIPSNAYCQAVGIEVPRLENVKDQRDASPYSLLLVCLLERGGPLTLREAADRFEEAGIAAADRALASLKRCRPARAPIHRDEDHYYLDPHHHETGLWVFRLGLRRPRPRPKLVRPEPEPLPAEGTPLNAEQLREAWRRGLPNTLSAQRVALCILDAHGRAMRPDEVVGFVSALGDSSRLTMGSSKYWRRGAPIRVREDGLWEIDPSHKAVASARAAARDQLQAERRRSLTMPSPSEIQASIKESERKRAANAAHLESLSRVLVHAFPPKDPAALVLLDVKARRLDTWWKDELPKALVRLSEYDIIVGVEIHGLLRRLGFEQEHRRLLEIGPPQKTRQVNRRGRTLKVTLDLLVRGSCGISRPFGDPEKLHEYMKNGQETKLRRRLESDAKSLFALYQYGRLHGSVRLNWGFLDEQLPVPWVYRDEERLYGLKETALERGIPLEIVVGSAPGWEEPWSRAKTAWVYQRDRWWTELRDDEGGWIDENDVQAARLVEP